VKRTLAALRDLIAGSSRASKTSETVVLLHGLMRSRAAMLPLERHLIRAGYAAHSIDYPSLRDSIDELARRIRSQVVERTTGAERVHFVTHSFGGILVRHIMATDPLPHLGRVVMLAPPNQGSEIVDQLESWGLGPLLGPSGRRLGTTEQSAPRSLGPVGFELGVIAGDHSWSPLLSRLLPGHDDGRVAVDSTRIDGQTDFLVVNRSHTFIMNAADVHQQVVHFLDTGAFRRGDAAQE
jgi:pimeloyl-ACP methyl ester carboxylesterase